MTREPDRFDKQARELDRWIVRHYGVPEYYTSANEIAAALRAAEASALERAAQEADRWHMNRNREWRSPGDCIRALAPSHGAPPDLLPRVRNG